MHNGFNDSIESFFGKGIVKKYESRLKSNRDSQLYITGHSKGGALAYLAALLLARSTVKSPWLASSLSKRRDWPPEFCRGL